MSDVVIASNITTKVNRAIGGATTINANCYAVVTYAKTGLNISGTGGGLDYGSQNNEIINRYFGPAQTVPNTFNSINTYGAATVTGTYTLLSGVEFINSP